MAPGETRQTLSFFRERLSALRQEMPDDPQKAMDKVLEEMLVEAKAKIQRGNIAPPNDA